MCIQKVLRFLTFTYLCIYIHTYIHTPTSVYIYMCVCMYVCMYTYTYRHTSLYVYVHIHLHIRIYMNICNICNNHEYTMHPTSPEASNPFNSETPTPDLHRTSYKLDIHTLSYIYTILCVYIYIHISWNPIKSWAGWSCQGWDGKWKEGSLVLHEDCMPLKGELMEGCVCGCLYIHVRHIYRSTMCLCRRRKRKMRRGRHRYCTQCPG